MYWDIQTTISGGNGGILKGVTIDSLNQRVSYMLTNGWTTLHEHKSVCQHTVTLGNGEKIVTMTATPNKNKK